MPWWYVDVNISCTPGTEWLRTWSKTPCCVICGTYISDNCSFRTKTIDMTPTSSETFRRWRTAWAIFSDQCIMTTAADGWCQCWPYTSVYMYILSFTIIVRKLRTSVNSSRTVLFKPNSMQIKIANSVPRINHPMFIVADSTRACVGVAGFAHRRFVGNKLWWCRTFDSMMAALIRT